MAQMRQERGLTPQALHRVSLSGGPRRQHSDCVRLQAGHITRLALGFNHQWSYCLFTRAYYCTRIPGKGLLLHSWRLLGAEGLRLTVCERGGRGVRPDTASAPAPIFGLPGPIPLLHGHKFGLPAAIWFRTLNVVYATHIHASSAGWSQVQSVLRLNRALAKYGRK